MKDSGVEWIGDIPDSWNILPVYNGFKERKEKVSDIEWEPLSVTKSGIVRQLENAAKSDNHNDRKKVCVGDFAINSRSDRKESCGLSSLTGSVSLINTVLIPNVTIYSPKYVKYLLKNYGFAEEFYRWGTGIVADLWSTNFERMKNIKLPLPPLSEQQKIAEFLDEKVKEIDNAIEKTKETIELYKRYKQAVITEAVTKGLDPNVEMKSINVRGINKIPKTWSVVDFTKVNYIRGRLGWKGLKADEYVDQGYPFLSAFNIINDKLSWDNLNYITQERYDESPEIKLKEKDLLLVKDGNGIGKCAFIDSLPLGETTVNSSLAVITPLDLVNYKYEYYFFLSAIFQNVIWLLKNGMGVPHLTQESMKNIKMPLPPIKEQIETALYLENKCNYIDKVISKEESTILMLEKYKKSLIYECVTGKRSI